MSDDLVLTPGGFRPRSAVHLVEPGHSISAAGGRLRKLAPNGAVIADAGSLPPRPVGEPLHPFNIFVPEGQVPGLGSGWITFASWNNTTGKPVNFFTTT